MRTRADASALSQAPAADNSATGDGVGVTARVTRRRLRRRFPAGAVSSATSERPDGAYTPLVAAASSYGAVAPRAVATPAASYTVIRCGASV